MSNLGTIVTTVALAFVLTTSLMVTLATVPETVSAYTIHNPISIIGDVDFTPANGVTGGSGTESDPYIIEGWEIDATTAHGIMMQDTTAHFAIRDCYVHDGGIGNYDGIYLLHCANGTVTGNTCSYNRFGILLDSSSNNTLSNNNCSSNNFNGVWLDSSSNNTLSDNDCHFNDLDGICLYRSSSNALIGNNCSSYNQDGIEICFYSDNNTLIGNNCSFNNDCGINIFARCSNNTVSGNNCSSNFYDGIALGSSNNTLNGNICSENENGIQLYSSNNAVSNNRCTCNYRGISLDSSSNNTLSDNTCNSNYYNGVRLASSSNNNTLSYNTCSLNGYNGISLESSSNYNTLNVNNCSNNDDGMGIELSSSNNNAVISNHCLENFAGILLSLSENNTVSGNNCSFNIDYGIWLSISSNNTVGGNNCSSNEDDGMYLLGSSSDNNTLISNNCRSNGNDGISLRFWADNNNLISNICSSNSNYGITLLSSSNNTLRNNSVSSNGYGIHLVDCGGTIAYHNSFFDSVVDHAYDDGGTENPWNASYPIGGNYWDNYTAVDEFSGPNQDEPGHDGIGDTPYKIDDDSFDYYPLMEPQNTPPTASFTVSPSTGYVNTVFSVDASSSFDVQDNTSVLEVRWDWESDGEWDTTWSLVKTATHQYSAEGTYTIMLEVRDTKEFVSNTTRQITVARDEVPPVADAGPDQTVTVGEEVTFDGSDSSDNVGIESYTWTFTYDEEERELHGIGPKFTFDIVGTYVVTLTVEDAEGGTDTDTVTITVEEEQEEEQDDADDKSFLESYGLPLGLAVALAIIALILFFVLKNRKGGSATAIAEEPASTDAQGTESIDYESPPPQS